ncbi:MAG TPA: hypothetical protein VMW75_26890 [Thermoanaerobaculia bacterium]|nr:hypothetical protein [Thermoanaerobaculia bacterium]
MRIGEVLHDAWAFDPKTWHGNQMGVAEDLTPAVTLLFDLLEERHVEYALVGGLAVLHYLPGRNTKDIDLLMAPSGLEALPELTVESRHDAFMKTRFAGVRLDLLLTTNPLFAKVLRAYTAIERVDDRPIPCATVEGLLLLKLYALPSLYRQGDFVRVGLYENDVATLLHAYRPALQPLMAELGKHLDALDLAAVKEVVPDLQRRFSALRPDEVSEETPPYLDDSVKPADSDSDP